MWPFNKKDKIVTRTFKFTDSDALELALLMDNCHPSKAKSHESKIRLWQRVCELEPKTVNGHCAIDTTRLQVIVTQKIRQVLIDEEVGR
jgi:hypothetical protein